MQQKLTGALDEGDSGCARIEEGTPGYLLWNQRVR